MFVQVAQPEKSHEIQFLAMHSIDDCLRKERLDGPFLQRNIFKYITKKIFKKSIPAVLCLNVGILYQRA